MDQVLALAAMVKVAAADHLEVVKTNISLQITQCDVMFGCNLLGSGSGSSNGSGSGSGNGSGGSTGSGSSSSGGKNLTSLLETSYTIKENK